MLMVLLCGCSSMQMRYAAEIQTDKGPAHYTYENTYEKTYRTAGTAWACGFTAIFYGGYCWAYLGKPYDGEAKTVASDAASELREKYQITNVEVKSETIQRLSWNPSTTKSNFELKSNNSLSSR